MNKYEIDMCNGTIMNKLISFALPLWCSSILQLMFNAVDIIVVGRFTGREALAAVGATTALINLFVNLFIGVSLGANVLCARYFASKENNKLSRVVHTSITFAIISGIVMIFAGWFGSLPALRLMATPENIIGQSVTYMRIYFMGMPFFMLYNFGASLLRAVGDTKRPLYFLIISGVTNAVLNIFLVTVFDMGVAGVAIATVISQLISCILVMRVLLTANTPYRVYIKKLKINAESLGEILKIGLPAGLQSMLINFSNTLLQSSVNSFGDIAMAGYTAANNVFGFLFVSINSISQACMSFTSQNLGAKKPDRIDKIIKDCLIIDIIFPVVMGALVYVFGHQIISIYNTDPEVINYGVQVLAYTTIPYFICGFMDLLPGALRGMGYSTIPMILSLLGTVGIRVLWIFGIFPHYRSLSFLFISYPVSWIVTAIMQVICLYFVRKKVFAKLKMQKEILQ